MTRDGVNHRVPTSEITRIADQPQWHKTKDAFSARNRFPGIVRLVEVDVVMALVEIEAGPHLATAAITRVDELGLSPGVPCVATVKATSVMVATDTD
jgi:molybdopterin-binding protein